MGSTEEEALWSCGVETCSDRGYMAPSASHGHREEGMEREYKGRTPPDCGTRETAARLATVKRGHLRLNLK